MPGPVQVAKDVFNDGEGRLGIVRIDLDCLLQQMHRLCRIEWW